MRNQMAQKCYNTNMKASIITIGDEILLGQILDTNSCYLARELARVGAETIEMRSVADTHAAILHAVEETFLSSDVVLVTGGLGPTKDDITKQTLADYFHTTLERNAQAEEWLQLLLAAQPERLKNPYNESQVFLPRCCVPLRNRKGTASGMWFEKDGKILVSLPGVPFETETIFPQEVLPRLKAKFTSLNVRYKMLTVYQVPESDIAQRLEKFEKSLPNGISLAYLPSPGFVRLRLTAKTNPDDLPILFEQLKKEISDFSFLENTSEKNEENIALRLRAAGKKIACAESCSGGNIAHLITSVAGSSAYFLGGVVAYANEVKTAVLGVRPEDLKQYGAVSQTVACQMAQGVRRLTGADYAVSSTGIAGPDGGTAEKPVGTVYIGVSGPNGTTAKKYWFAHTRERNIGRASVQALVDLLAEIEKK